MSLVEDDIVAARRPSFSWVKERCSCGHVEDNRRRSDHADDLRVHMSGRNRGLSKELSRQG